MLSFELKINAHEGKQMKYLVSIEEADLPTGKCEVKITDSLGETTTKVLPWNTMAARMAEIFVCLLCGFRSEEEYKSSKG
jgi:hypothetical protein